MHVPGARDWLSGVGANIDGSTKAQAHLPSGAANDQKEAVRKGFDSRG